MAGQDDIRQDSSAEAEARKAEAKNLSPQASRANPQTANPQSTPSQAAASPGKDAKKPTQEAADPAAAPPADASGENAPTPKDAAAPATGRLRTRSRSKFKTLLLVGGAAASVFVITFGTVMFVAWLKKTQRSAQDIFASGAMGSPSPEEVAKPAERPSAQDVAGMTYDELIQRGDRSAATGDWVEAARYYTVATQREQSGLPRALLAQHCLSRAMLAMGNRDEALRIAMTLRSVSWPGDELWRGAMITSIDALGQSARWQELYADLNLLRANSGRYGDALALNAWIAYRKAVAAMRRTTLSTPSDVLPGDYKSGCPDAVLPVFGRDPYDCPPLSVNDIHVRSGEYGDGTVIANTEPTVAAVYPADKELISVRANGAPVGKVLEALAKAANLSIQSAAPFERPISASLEPMPPEKALSIIVGAVGCEAIGTGTTCEVKPADQAVVRLSDATLRAAAQIGAERELRAFRSLHPDSRELPEIQYALARFLMNTNQAQEGAAQMAALCKEFPHSPWSFLAHYVAGRTWGNAGKWAEAEKEMALVADLQQNHPLSHSAFFWQGQYQAQQGKYNEALKAFREALTRAEPPDAPAKATAGTLIPEILLDIAQCMEKTGCSPVDIEQRYTEIKTRFADTEYARRADHRLARMALDAGDWVKATRRYEWYLGVYPLTDEESFTVALELVQTYMRTGDYMKAVLLGEEVRAAQSPPAVPGSVAATPEAPKNITPCPTSRDLVPLLLDACDKARMPQTALRIIDQSVQPGDWAMFVRKANFLIDSGACDTAEQILGAVESKTNDTAVLCQVKVARARILMAAKKDKPALDLCREAAFMSKATEVQTAALMLMGQYFEHSRQYERAAHCYSGECCLTTPVLPSEMKKAAAEESAQ